MEEMIANFFVDSKQKDSRDVRVHNNDAKFLRSSYDFCITLGQIDLYSLCIEYTMRVASHIYTHVCVRL